MAANLATSSSSSFSAGANSGFSSSSTAGEAPGVDADGQPQVLGHFFQRLAAGLQIEAVAGVGQAFGAGVAGQIENLRGRYGIAEEQRRHFRQLVRLVEDDRVAGRQQLGHAFVAQHDVGEEQVVIDDDQVGRHRLAPRLHDEAVLVVRAILAEAVFTGRRGVVPHRRVFRNFQTFGLVTALRHLGKHRDAAGVCGILAGQEAAVGQRAFEVVGADVIGAPLQQGDLDRRLEGIAHHRQILVEQLVLQGLGAGGDDHLAARLQRRHQIGESLARAGPRLGDENRTAVDGGGDALGHVELLVAHAITADRLRQRAIGGEEFREGGQEETPEKLGPILADGPSINDSGGPRVRAGASNFPQVQGGGQMIGIVGGGLDFSGQAD